jgi:hypothetical protein
MTRANTTRAATRGKPVRPRGAAKSVAKSVAKTGANSAGKSSAKKSAKGALRNSSRTLADNIALRYLELLSLRAQLFEAEGRRGSR